MYAVKIVITINDARKESVGTIQLMLHSFKRVKCLQTVCVDCFTIWSSFRKYHSKCYILEDRDTEDRIIIMALLQIKKITPLNQKSSRIEWQY